VKAISPEEMARVKNILYFKNDWNDLKGVVAYWK
jgi:hypothetical protein